MKGGNPELVALAQEKRSVTRPSRAAPRYLDQSVAYGLNVRRELAMTPSISLVAV